VLNPPNGGEGASASLRHPSRLSTYYLRHTHERPVCAGLTGTTGSEIRDDRHGDGYYLRVSRGRCGFVGCFMPFPDHRAGERGSCYTCFAKSSKFLRR
jgi:hypothetical protein